MDQPKRIFLAKFLAQGNDHIFDNVGQSVAGDGLASKLTVLCF